MNGDYDAFIAATNDTNVTKEQFTAMTTRTTQMTAEREARQKAQQAIQDNDFSAWRDAMSTISSETLAQETFDALVQLHETRTKIDQAIASNDFAAWKQAMTNMQTIEATQFTQAHFDQIVQHRATRQTADATADSSHPLPPDGAFAGRRSMVRAGGFGFDMPMDVPAAQS